MTELVRAVRAVLDTLPEEEEVEEEAHDQQTAAAAELPGRRDSRAKIGEFTIDCDLSGPRVWFVQVGRTAILPMPASAGSARQGRSALFDLPLNPLPPHLFVPARPFPPSLPTTCRAPPSSALPR